MSDEETQKPTLRLSDFTATRRIGRRSALAALGGLTLGATVSTARAQTDSDTGPLGDAAGRGALCEEGRLAWRGARLLHALQALQAELACRGVAAGPCP